MKIIINPNKEVVEKISKALKENNGYCPCALLQVPETKCQCKEFRE